MMIAVNYHAVVHRGIRKRIGLGVVFYRCAAYKMLFPNPLHTPADLISVFGCSFFSFSTDIAPGFSAAAKAHMSAPNSALSDVFNIHQFINGKQTYFVWHFSDLRIWCRHNSHLIYPAQKPDTDCVSLLAKQTQMPLSSKNRQTNRLIAITLPPQWAPGRAWGGHRPASLCNQTQSVWHPHINSEWCANTVREEGTGLTEVLTDNDNTFICLYITQCMEWSSEFIGSWDAEAHVYTGGGQNKRSPANNILIQNTS